jgi:hypothetical protein
MLSASAMAAYAEAGPPVVFGDASVAFARARGGSNERQMPFRTGDVWTGMYYCAQGITELELEIGEVNGNDVSATFSFFHRPTSTSGRFEMNGSYTPAGRRMRFEAGDWVSQPPGYQTVDLEGEVDLDTMEYTGRVIGPGCRIFSLRRR